MTRFYRDMAYYNFGSYRGGWDIDGGGPFIQQAAQMQTHCVGGSGYLGRGCQPSSSTHDRDIEAHDHGTALLQYSSWSAD